jgi:hypothetical protein
MSDFLGGLDKVYSTFVMRDLKYILTGGTPLGFLLYHHHTGTIGSALWHAPTLGVIGFVAAAYFLGVAPFFMRGWPLGVTSTRTFAFTT